MSTETAEVLARSAIAQAKRNASAIMQAAPSAGPVLEHDVVRAVERAVYQDRPLRSWRLWGAISAVVTGVLAIPEVQVVLTAAVAGAVPVAWAPVATAVLAAALGAISKGRDPRPLREPQP